MTIHKSQGLTLEKAVIDIGDRDIGTGCTYVALSRVKTLQGCYFMPVEWKRLQQINDSITCRMRQAAEKELCDREKP